MEYHWESMNNIRNDFRNDLQDAIMSFKADIIQGLVRNCSYSFFFFKLNDEAYLRKGSQIKLSRSYSGSGGLNIWLKDVQEKNRLLFEEPQFVEDLNYEESSYEHIKNNLSSSLLNSNVSYGEYIEISGRVIELYDSTWKSKMESNGQLFIRKAACW